MPEWQRAFTDNPLEGFSEVWFLEGDQASAKHTDKGFVLKSGPVDARDAGHSVLWIKQSFAVDVRIECVFTRLARRSSIFPSESFQSIYVHSRGCTIRLILDSIFFVAYVDNIKAHDPARSHPGWIGLR